MLHRQSIESRVWKNPYLWQLWCYCLLRANHKEKWVPVKTGRGSTEVFVGAGQFIFGQIEAGKALGQKPNTTYKRLVKLKKMGNCHTQSHRHFSLVTICNWELYQKSKKRKSEATSYPSHNQVITKSQPNHTNNNDKNVNNGNKYSQNSDEFRLSELLFNEIINRKPDFKGPNLQTWSVHIDRMIRLDNRSAARVEEVIRWCQKDPFWQNNILSTDKLRKQFDRLELEMMRTGTEPQKETISERLERMKAEGRLND
ncbi:MAG: hypothetical protein ACYS18_10380 [Planctomycetota bacterium]